MDTYISSHFMLLSNGVLDINYYRSRITETIKEIWASTTTDRSNRIWTCRSMRWKHKPPLYHQRYSQAIGVQQIYKCHHWSACQAFTFQTKSNPPLVLHETSPTTIRYYA